MLFKDKKFIRLDYQQQFRQWKTVVNDEYVIVLPFTFKGQSRNCPIFAVFTTN